MSLWSRIANVFRGEHLNREIEEEFQAHMQEAVAEGRDPEEARRAFGSMLRQRESGHEIRVVGWLESLRADVIFGWRQLKRTKVTSIAAILSLGLGMGSCVAAFRLMDALVWRPLPVAHTSRLFALSRQYIGFDGKPAEYDSWAYPDFTLMRTAAKGQAELISVSYAERTDLTYASDDEMEKAYVQYVSGWMFSGFGLKPELGRLLTADDDRVPGASPYAVLSYDYWNHRFSRDPNVIGRTLRIADRSFEIVGVGPKSFTGTERGAITDVFIPTMMNAYATQDSVTWQRVFAIVEPGVALEPMRLKLEAVSHGFEVERSKKFKGMTKPLIERFLNQRLLIEPAAAGVSGLQRDYSRALGILGVLVAVVLLIACVNVANLMTAQAAGRAHEIALRVSIGAGRGRLVQLIVVESAMLATASSAVAGLFAAWSAPFVLAMISTTDAPVRLELPQDWRMGLFAIGLIMVVVLLLGLLPALRVSAVEPVNALKGSDDPHARRRLMRATIALQVAFCFLVIFLSSLFVTTFQRLSNRPLGFSTDRLLLLDTVAAKGQPEVVWEQVGERLGETQGVEAVALSSWPILQGYSMNSFISVNGTPPGPILTHFLLVTPGWLETMKISLVAGREFLRTDDSPRQAIVNEKFVKTYFNSENALGRTFLRGANQHAYQIVGIVRDVPYRSLREDIVPVAFLRFPETDQNGVPQPASYGTFVLHTSANNPLVLANTLRRKVADLHTGLRVSNVRTQAGVVRAQTIRERLLATLAVFFAGVALLLASIGLYGVLNYSVLQRRREIGIRIAVGARSARIVGLVTGEIATAVLAGSAFGLALGLSSARSVQSLLYGAKATDVDMVLWPALAILSTAVVGALPAVCGLSGLTPRRFFAPSRVHQFPLCRGSMNRKRRLRAHRPPYQARCRW